MTEKKDIRIRSHVYDDICLKAPNRAMLRAVGFNDENFKKPQVGVVSNWAETTPCNVHLNDLAQFAKEGVSEAGGVPVQFNTITVADGIAMGTPGMRFSLPSRDIIADSIETMVAGQNFDSFVAIGGCDKNMPGCAIAIANTNVPAVFVYGGTIAPGRHEGKDIDLVSVFEGVGKWNNGDISDNELKKVECAACPGPGACGGMYTANTMAAAIEAMGLSLPGSASNPAVTKEKNRMYMKRVKQYSIFRRNLSEDILTREAFENAITVVLVCRINNAILHLLAIAHAAEVELSIEDFNEFQEKVPHLADLKPSGKYVFQDLFNVGGVQGVMKYLHEKGYIHGDCLTVTGKTIAENLAEVDHLSPGQDVIMPLENPKRADGPLIVLKGNLAPEGAVAKVSGVKVRRHVGEAKVFDNEQEAIAVMANDIVKGDVVIVIRWSKRGTGMPEMLLYQALS